MATLIPTLSECRFDAAGEKRLAERLSRLGDDTICWHNVSVGRSELRPDFIVMNPRRGLLTLEVKDWGVDTIITIDPQSATIRTDSGEKKVLNPLEQARNHARGVADLLQRDPLLIATGGDYAGKLVFPWNYGVVLSRITRRQFDDKGLAAVMPADRVICQDEVAETVGAADFERRLWAVASRVFPTGLTAAQIARVRWNLFPEVRISPRQASLFTDAPPPDDLLHVMDLQQEQLARSLGAGHRVIHGVAGSGKTLILVHRAAHLAKAVSRPVLFLCYNDALARWLAQAMEARGLSDKAQVCTFHSWCRAQLMAHHLALPPDATSDTEKEAFFDELVRRAINGVQRGQIPIGQYSAVFVDEGHDFRPEWLQLVVKMVDPATKSLLVAYDDAQAIYREAQDGGRKFSFKSVGIEAAGRTTILKVNYRNTDEILRFAREVAQKILKPAEATEDGVPLLAPECAGRHGPAPKLVHRAEIREEAEFIAKHFKDAHDAQVPWRDMAVIYRRYEPVGAAVLSLLRASGIPVVFHRDATFTPDEDKVMAVTMHSCKGLEFPLVAIPGVDRMQVPDAGELATEEARLLYVAMTRATRELVVSGRAADSAKA